MKHCQYICRFLFTTLVKESNKYCFSRYFWRVQHVVCPVYHWYRLAHQYPYHHRDNPWGAVVYPPAVLRSPSSDALSLYTVWTTPPDHLMILQLHVYIIEKLKHSRLKSWLARHQLDCIIAKCASKQRKNFSLHSDHTDTFFQYLGIFVSSHQVKTHQNDPCSHPSDQDFQDKTFPLVDELCFLSLAVNQNVPYLIWKLWMNRCHVFAGYRLNSLCCDIPHNTIEHSSAYQSTW